MQIVVVEKRGSAEELRCVERPRPQPTAGQLLVRVQVAGVNYADVMQREGRYPTVLKVPYAAGHEIVGVVEAVGEGVTSHALGDRVAAIVPQGGYAEYAVAPAILAWPVPEAVPSREAAALLAQGMTAWLLVQQLVRRGDAVLVTAAAGGVGAIAVQLAALQGARHVVGAASSASKCEVVEQLGAQAVRYDWAQWELAAQEPAARKGFDVVLDATGGPVRDACYRVLAASGRMGIYGNSSQGEETWDAERWHALLMANQSIHGFAVTRWMASHPGFAPEAFAHLAGLAARGALRLPVHAPYPLADAAQAHRDLEGRRTRGKVVLEVEGAV